MAPFVWVPLLVALSALLFLDGLNPSRANSTLLGDLLGTRRQDQALWWAQLLSPFIVLFLAYLAIARSPTRGGNGGPARGRLSVRALMIWLAVLTVACFAGSRMWERRRHRINLAFVCGVAARGIRHSGATYRLNTDIDELDLVADEGTRARTPAQVEDRGRRAVYWDALEQKYERASRHPWLPVRPNPPPP
jgi:hypothetical protein